MAFHEQFQRIHQDLVNACEASPLRPAPPTVIAVSKQQPSARIQEALAAGHRHFGENRVQEARARWPELKSRYDGVMLHLIGPLQSNKVREAMALFDVIHTVDRARLADALRAESARQGRTPACLIQVNTGEEAQKSGVTPDQLAALLAHCRAIGLAIEGLMCIPPANEPPAPHFALLHKLAEEHGLQTLSMGMSGDYETAARFGASYVRIGTALLGARPGAA